MYSTVNLSHRGWGGAILPYSPLGPSNGYGIYRVFFIDKQLFHFLFMFLLLFFQSWFLHSFIFSLHSNNSFSFHGRWGRLMSRMRRKRRGGRWYTSSQYTRHHISHSFLITLLSRRGYGSSFGSYLDVPVHSLSITGNISDISLSRLRDGRSSDDISSRSHCPFYSCFSRWFNHWRRGRSLNSHSIFPSSSIHFFICPSCCYRSLHTTAVCGRRRRFLSSSTMLYTIHTPLTRRLLPILVAHHRHHTTT